MSTSPSIIPVPEGKRIVSSASTSRGGHAKFQTMSSVMDNVLDRSSESSTRNLPSLTLSQSTTNIEIAEAEAAQVPLKLISDTVSHPPYTSCIIKQCLTRSVRCCLVTSIGSCSSTSLRQIDPADRQSLIQLKASGTEWPLL